MEQGNIKDDHGLCCDTITKLNSIMASLPKEDVFKDKSGYFKVLSDSTRIKILYLLTEGELCVCELIYALDKPQSTTSHHLNVLKNAGLITSRKEGVWIHYKLSNPSVIKKIKEITEIQ